jgi:hypothetical protein
MVTYHGATVDVRVSRIAAEGKIIKEYLGLADGTGAEQVFHTKFFPITTDAGVATDLETEVDLYARDPATLVWTEADDDGSDFDIVGATGTVTLEELYNVVGIQNFPISISYYTDYTIARGQGASIEFSRDKEVIHELGNPAPQEIKTGHYTVSGSIDALISTNDMVTKGLSESDFYKLPPDCSLYLYPNKNAASQPYFKVTNVVFTDISVKASLKGMMAVGLKYSGLLLAQGTNPA